MLKSIHLLTALTIICACQNAPQDSSINKQQKSSTDADTSFIHQDTANIMKSSYQQSISLDSPAKLQSWTVNADALRNYLADPNVKEINISLAHTMKYISSGNFGVPAGLSPTALTVIITGVGSTGLPINYNTSYVLNRAKPCPPICLSSPLSEE